MLSALIFVVYLDFWIYNYQMYIVYLLLVASSIVYLLSPASIAINGQNLIIDDGWSL